MARAKLISLTTDVSTQGDTTRWVDIGEKGIADIKSIRITNTSDSSGRDDLSTNYYETGSSLPVAFTLAYSNPKSHRETINIESFVIKDGIYIYKNFLLNPRESIDLDLTVYKDIQKSIIIERNKNGKITKKLNTKNHSLLLGISTFGQGAQAKSFDAIIIYI